ncbi:MAG: Porphobilinogen deaminase [Holosporales bacterium]
MIRIGTRGSPLALSQANLVKDALFKHGYDATLVIIKTSGDLNTKTPLTDIGGKALFAKEIQLALLNDEIDIGVHSLKDLECDHPKGLMLLATLPREDPRDLLICNNDIDPSFDHFTLGTCSPRRAFFAKQIFHKVHITPLRGNVQTRLEKLSSKICDATILAIAGLKRLGILKDIQEQYKTLILPTHLFPPASCQGIIGIEGKPHFKEICDLINDPDTMKMAMIERTIVKDFNGTCHSAIGILTRINEKKVYVAYQDPKTLTFQSYERTLE